jgi:hypothetical protein
MMKLGIFGDQTTNHELLGQLNMIPEVSVAGLYYSGNAEVPDGFTAFSSPIGLMDSSDAILILSNKNISNDLIKLILRKSRHIYLKSVPSLHIKEIRELIDLEKEAGIATSIYNPFTYILYLDPYSVKYEKPFLINLRTSFNKNLINPSHETLLLVTALNRLVQSNYKRLDVYGSRGNSDQLVVSLRIEYENGCVVAVTLTEEPTSGSGEIFHQAGHVSFDIDNSLFQHYPKVNQELVDIQNFIGRIRNRDKQTNLFDSLRNGIQIVHEIKEHLRFNGIDF